MIASESGHFYLPDGSPYYEVINRARSAAHGYPVYRPATIRDAKQVGAAPSVTTITRLLPAHGLDSWKIRQAILSALTIPRIEGELDENFVDRIIRDSREQARIAAETGTAIHGAIERYARGLPVDPDLISYAESTLHELGKYFASECNGFSLSSLCEAEKSFYWSRDGMPFGGKVDLYSVPLNFVLDFKTKPCIDSGKSYSYDTHKIQLSAYRVGLGLPENARMVNVFIGVSDGKIKIEEHSPCDKWINRFFGVKKFWYDYNFS